MAILKLFERIVIKYGFFVALIFVEWVGPVPLAVPNGIPRRRVVALRCSHRRSVCVGGPARTASITAPQSRFGGVRSCVIQMCNLQ